MRISGIRWWLVGVGVLVCALGLVWALQGAGVIGNSGMSGHEQWLVIGCVVFAVGLGLMYRGVNAGRAKT